jgi:hypothetical protein
VQHRSLAEGMGQRQRQERMPEHRGQQLQGKLSSYFWQYVFSVMYIFTSGEG